MLDQHEVSPRRLLRSWKEIAAHLATSVRSAQRWEKSARLPVHRSGNGLVVAYTDELDSWLKEGSPKGTGTLRRLWVWIPAPFVMVTLIWLFVGTFPLFDENAVPVSVQIQDGQLEALNSGGKVVWAREWNPPVDRSAVWDWPSVHSSWDKTLIEDIDGDGAAEILVNSFPSYPADSRGMLICLDSTGRERWSFAYGRALTLGGRSFSDVYIGHFVRRIHAAGHTYILTVAVHEQWYPCQIALLEPATGQLIDEYWHPGGISHLLLSDLDGDGSDELLLAGVNNPGAGLGHPALLVLDVPFSEAPHSEGLPFLDFFGGRELAYLVFPRMDMVTLSGKLLLIDQIEELTGDRILVRLQLKDGDETAFYLLNRRLQLHDFRVSDSAVAYHDQLFRDGKLDHTFSGAEEQCLGQVLRLQTAPDGNDAELDQAWIPCTLH